MLRYRLILLFVWAACSLSAQRIDTELICSWRSRPSVHKAALAYPAATPLAPGIDLLTFPDAQAAAAAYVRLSRAAPVSAVQYNWRVEPRVRPNDPDYPRQDNMRRAGFETAWELTTGGTTPDGKEIVTAILDAGFDVSHEDLKENLWTNAAEVPEDGLDNDGNGFIDDRYGWNFITDSPEYPVATHGTQVAGLLGAVGNNGRGVSGTNWTNRLMLFSINTVADIIAAYQYTVDQRQLFNETDGQRGAFVVATNASFGIEGGTCADFPVWGEMYNLLGSVGILTAASVANAAEDVDQSGDMPTDCPSNFLLGVTNVDQDDRRYPSAGYGRVSVDLGAPGEGSFTTRPEDTYGSFGSTSAAAPYVTGAISLLYATPCDHLQELVVTDPPAAALLVRRSLLAAVRPQPGLEAITVTGGVLDVGGAQDQLLKNCAFAADDSPDPSVYPNPTDGALDLRVPAPGIQDGELVEVYDALGRRISVTNPGSTGGQAASIPLDVSGLPPGVYFVRLRRSGGEVVVPFLRR